MVSMAKQAKRYLEIDPWVIEERGFHSERAMASEAIFALGNEFMGARGYFEEGFSGPRMQGCYFNGIYMRGKHRYSTKFKGFAEEYTYMINAVDWLWTRLAIGGETLDLARSSFSDFVRRVDMRDGVLERSFLWNAPDMGPVRVAFRRLLSMTDPRAGFQEIEIEALEGGGTIEIECGLDFNILYHLRGRCVWAERRADAGRGSGAILAAAEGSGHRIASSFRLRGPDGMAFEPVRRDRFVGCAARAELTPGRPLRFVRQVAHHTEKDAAKSDDAVWGDGIRTAAERPDAGFAAAREAQRSYWDAVWRDMDIAIEGDAANQQGIRFCLFHLHQTYHGFDPALNVGAKGLTGEHYWGVAWWDTETYCLPFYLFTDRRAAENLLEYRYRTLPGALERAEQLGDRGARYPMCTIDGEEVCDVWQHGDAEIHVSAAVAYGIWLWDRVFPDSDWLFDHGTEILVQIARYYAARGAWGQTTGQFGYFGVMGADEMHTMVDHNAYTNVMGQLSLRFAAEAAERMRDRRPAAWKALSERLGVSGSEVDAWRHLADSTHVPTDPETGLIEQHRGYFELPHLDYHSIPDAEFPLHVHWPYLKRMRFDLIKQPDVLLLMLFFSSRYTREQKRAHYDYYEPRCCHESSLSPSVHSILAAELGRGEAARDYARYAFRLDLDDYNNNTWEGLHVTSMGGAWMNIVYGFGGMRTDGDRLAFAPLLPAGWDAVSFRLVYRDTRLRVRIDREAATFTAVDGPPVEIDVFGERLTVAREGRRVPLPAGRAG
jgi:maltose phosphorylase